MKLLLATLHSRYSHASLALPSLAACLGDVEGLETVIRELTVNEEEETLFRTLSAEGADVIGFSCYIWNIEKTLALAARLKMRGRPFILLGGPEVSFDAETVLKGNPAVDAVVRGEGERVFREAVIALKRGESLEGVRLEGIRGVSFRVGDAIVSNAAALPVADLDKLPSPFAAGIVDTKKPLVYLETSRGCPFSCAFCLSANDEKVRTYSMARVENDLEYLMEREVPTIKFVDRTFNCNARRADAIWRFILGHNRSSRFHFEIAADLLTDENIEVLKGVPASAFRFEIGVQSVSGETLGAVERRSDTEKLFERVSRLLLETAVVVHLDLVAGLPGEGMEGFLASLEGVLAAGAHHVQVEPLKVLKGAPMEEIAKREGYRWERRPPYRISVTPWLKPEEIRQIERIARLVDLIYNSGRFRQSLDVIGSVLPLSEFFFKLSGCLTSEGLASLPLTDLFGVFWRYGKSFLGETAHPLFADALAYDHCLAECPPPGTLPPYFAGDRAHGGRLSRKSVERLKGEFGLASCRVRAFAWDFVTDRRCTEGEGCTGKNLLFLYVSRPGEREKIEVLRR